MKSLPLFLLLVSTLVVRAQEIPRSHSRFYALTENKGQWAPQVLFQSRSQGQNIWVQQHGFIYDLRDYSALKQAHEHPEAKTDSAVTYKADAIAAHFIGSNAVSNITKEVPSKQYYNYFKGNDKSRWVSEVRSYQEVTLHNFYDGVDLKVFDNDAAFKYELWCDPGTDVSKIVLEYKNAQSVRIDEQGNLVIATKLGNLIEKAPVAYELYKGSLNPVKCAFVLEGNKVSFKLGNYHEDATLVIDPVLVFATYSGAHSDNFGMTATYGYDGSAYAAGTLFGNDYPTPDPLAWNVTTNMTVANTNSVTCDVYVSKYSADGSTMIWTNFIGGGDNTQGTETANSLICDKQNNLYLFGVTSSLDFPIQGGFQSSHAGGTPIVFASNGSDFSINGTDLYIAKFSADGHSLLGSTYMGGSLNDGVNFNITNTYDSLTHNYGDQFRGEIMIDSLGNCMVAACTWSTDFPTQNPFQAANAGKLDAVIFHMSPDLSTLHWSSYFGGSDYDACYSVKLDSSYNVVFAGGTISSNLPGTAGAYLTSFQGGKADGFVAKLTANGQTLVRSSYIGTNSYDQTYFVEVNRNDEIFVYGQTLGAFPTINATGYPNSGQYIMKLQPDLTAAMNSFVFGSGNGSIDISPSAFLVDICGNMYVSGWGGNVLGGPAIAGLPVSSDAFRSVPPNGYDFYLAVFERDFDGLLYGTYMGGNQAAEHVDGGTSRFDKNGIVYQSVCGGCGGFSDFPTTTNAWSQTNENTANNNCNNIVFKFNFQLIPDANFLTSDSTVCAGTPITFDNFSSANDSYLWDFGNGDTTSIIFNPVVTYSTPGTFEVLLTVTDSVCLLTDTARITINVLPVMQLEVSNDTISCVFNPFTLTANSFGTADTFIWSSNDQFTDTLNTSVADSTLLLSFPNSATYYVMGSNPGCRLIDSVHVYIVDGAMILTGDTIICQGDQSTLTANMDIPGITFDYVWTPANAITPTSQDNQVIAHPTNDQWIVVNAIGSNGCNDVDSIFINVQGIFPNVVATADPPFILPDSVTTLTATPNMAGFSYSWSPTEGVTNPNSRVTTARVPETTVFTVSVSDGTCTKSDTVTVFALEFVCDDPFIFVPNAFTPNGDGENDKLFVRTVVTSSFLFRVYDRWGELVFESTDRLVGWDGTFRNRQLGPDVYDYYLEATCVGGMETIIKGNITLIR